MQTIKLADRKSLVTIVSVLMGNHLNQCYLIASPKQIRSFFDDIMPFKQLQYCLFINYDPNDANTATLYVLGKDESRVTVANLIVGIFTF